MYQEIASQTLAVCLQGNKAGTVCRPALGIGLPNLFLASLHLTPQGKEQKDNFDCLGPSSATGVFLCLLTFV